MIKKLLYIILFCLLAVSAFGADYYIDPSLGGGTETGLSPANAYHSWTDATISAGNDYRQLCGTTETLGATLTITADGTSGDHIILGAYNADDSHEDGGNETFGTLCSGGLAKPEIRMTATATEDIIATENVNSSQFLEFNSIKLTHAGTIQTGDTGMYINSNYNVVRYCYLYNIEYGVRIGHITSASNGGGNNNTIEYNFFDHNDTTNEDGIEGDSVNLHIYADDNLVQYNHMTGTDHGGVAIQTGDDNIIQYNYIYSTNGHEDFGVAWDYWTGSKATGNVVRFNWIEDYEHAIQPGGGDNNEVYGNVLICTDNLPNSEGHGCIQFVSNLASSLSGTTNSKFYNNVLYGYDSSVTHHNGIYFVSVGSVAVGDDIDENYIFNNIILNFGENCIREYDLNGVITVDNYFYNNICYGWNQDDAGEGYAEWPYGTHRASAAAFDAGTANADNNLDTNPGVNNAAAHQFWPASAGSNIVGNGCDANNVASDCYDAGGESENILDPDTTDLTASPPTVALETQPTGSWYIGAYDEESGAGPASGDNTGLSITGGSIN